MSVIDEKDRKILNQIQVDFPVDSRPYKILAEKIGIREDELIQRINQMKKDLLIRRIGGNFSPDRLGYYSTLCAAKVPKEKIEVFTKTVNEYSGVTHNYKRDHEFNIWFTFIETSVEIIKTNLENIKKTTQVETILNLPATRVFKISANFKV